MTDKKDVALKLALEALEECRRDPRLKYEHPYYDKTITAIRVALASKNEALAAVPEPHEQQEPVAWRLKMSLIPDAWQLSDQPHPEAALKEALYPSPPIEATPLASQRSVKPWVGLTQYDIDIAFDDTQEGGGFNEFAYAIEAKLREKNEPLEKNA